MLFNDYLTKIPKLLQFERHRKPGIVTVSIKTGPSDRPFEIHLHLSSARQLLKELEHVCQITEVQLTKFRATVDES